MNDQINEQIRQAAEELKSALQGTAGLQLDCMVPMSTLTSFKIGGPCAALITAEGPEGVKAAMEACRTTGLPLWLLGRGTNVLAPDEGFAGAVLRLSDEPGPVIDGRRVTCGAGYLLGKLARRTVEEGLMGMEGLAGIPGTVGGGAAMNAGAYGAELGPLLRSVTVLEEGRVYKVSVSPADFGYRKSPFIFPESIVLSAELELAPDDGHARERMADFDRRRREKQPLSFPSAGSAFKRPAGHFAGALIEGCGLKGLSVGGARVSELHAGFIISDGTATASDVRELIALVQQRVLAETGVQLVREVRFPEECILRLS